MTFEQYVLTVPWRHGIPDRAIVCDDLIDGSNFFHTEIGHREYYGGLLVVESCQTSVRRYIIDLHNASLEEKNK